MRIGPLKAFPSFERKKSRPVRGFAGDSFGATIRRSLGPRVPSPDLQTESPRLNLMPIVGLVSIGGPTSSADGVQPTPPTWNEGRTSVAPGEKHLVRSVQLPWFCGKPAESAASRTKSPNVGRGTDFWVCQPLPGMERIVASSGGLGLGRPGPPEPSSLTYLSHPYFRVRTPDQLPMKNSRSAGRYFSWSK